MEIRERISFVISAAIVAITFIGCITYYKYSEQQSIKSNIESAIVKGIEPLSVRCAYANANDNICIVYAASHGKIDTYVSKSTK